MSGEAGAPGTAGDRYKIEKPVGRHRAPPAPPRPDRFTVPIAAAAAILTAASLIALTAPAVAPDGRGAGVHGATVATAARTARTVHVPLTILPAPAPTIGASGAWDPETDAPVENPLSRPVPSQNFAGAAGTVEVPEALSGELVATTAPSTTDQQPATTAAATTTAPPAETTAATTTASATTTEEQPTVTATPTAEPTTDIGDLIDQILEDAIGEGGTP